MIQQRMKTMKKFNCSGTYIIQLDDVEIEAESIKEARIEFIEACLEEFSWAGDLDHFDYVELEEETDAKIL